jgi:hypothetical protein
MRLAAFCIIERAGSSGPKIESHVRARAEDVQLLIVPTTDSLEPYFRHDVDDWMLSVAQDGVKLITRGKKGAIITDWKGERRLAAAIGRGRGPR